MLINPCSLSGSWLCDDWSLLPAGIAIATGIVALIAGARGTWLARRAKATMAWRPVSGTITRCALQHDVQPRVGSAQPDAHTYRPRVEYSYTVDGQEHVGSRVFFGAHEWRGGSSEFAEWLLIEYPVGTKVQVFVDPNDTTEAVLERGGMT
jgi:hypothetical protein